MYKHELEKLLNERQCAAAEKMLQESDLPENIVLPLKIRCLHLQKNYKEALALTEQMLLQMPMRTQSKYHIPNEFAKIFAPLGSFRVLCTNPI